MPRFRQKNRRARSRRTPGGEHEGRASAALPEWAAVKFTDAQAAAMRPVGIEMLNKRGVCALHLKIIADAAGVGIGAAREALNIADTIGLITIERHLRGLY